MPSDTSHDNDHEPAPVLDRRAVFAWALYDWANSAYAIIVLAAVLPIFYGKYFSPVPPELLDALKNATDATRAQAQAAVDAATATTTLRWSLTNSVASLCSAIAAPILGAIADRSGRRKRMLLMFAGIGSAATVALVLIAQGNWLGASLVYIVSGIGFAGANVFYDALIIRVVHVDRRDMVSAIGFSLGYLSSGLTLALSLYIISDPTHIGLAADSGPLAVKICFLIVGLWWLLFSLPLIWWVGPDEPRPEFRLAGAVGPAFKEVIHTVKGLPKDRAVLIFLIAYWLYIDGVDTIIRMATSYGTGLGFDDTVMMKAFLLSQFVAFPAALVYGRIGQWIGAKRALLGGVVAYCGITVGAYFMRAGVDMDFYALAVGVGLVQGGIQALSRSFYSTLVPPAKASEYFGLYNLLGKSAAVVGPALMGVIGSLTGDVRIGILSLIALFVAGGITLLFVPTAAAHDPVTPEDAA